MNDQFPINDQISKTFFILVLAVALPLTIANILIAIFSKKRGRRFLMAVSILNILLIIGTVVCAKIGMDKFRVYDVYTYKGETRYSVQYHPCAWVALGLGSGALALSIFPFIFGLVMVIMDVGERRQKKDNSKEVAVHVETRFDGAYALITASSNVGIGLWTSICKGFASIFGVECKSYTKKIDRVTDAVNKKINKIIEDNPKYTYSDYRIVKEGRLTYTASVMGKKK